MLLRTRCPSVISGAGARCRIAKYRTLLRNRFTARGVFWCVTTAGCQIRRASTNSGESRTTRSGRRVSTQYAAATRINNTKITGQWPIQRRIPVRGSGITISAR